MKLATFTVPKDAALDLVSLLGPEAYDAIRCGEQIVVNALDLAGLSTLDELRLYAFLECVVRGGPSAAEMKKSDAPEAEVMGEMTLRAWAKRVHLLSREKGWWDAQVDPADEEKLLRSAVLSVALTKISLIHSEASEALEVYRAWPYGKPLRDHVYEIDKNGKEKPVGFDSEVSDVVIRIFDLTEALAIDIEAELRTLFAIPKSEAPKTLRGWAMLAHRKIRGLKDGELLQASACEVATINVLALIHAKLGQATLDFIEDGENLRLGETLAAVFDLAEAVGIDIEQAVAEKDAYNRTRAHRHGGKRI